MAIQRVAQFVTKISKYCNLRCAYCYEYAELGDKHRMSLETLGQIFKNIVAHQRVHQYEGIKFIWHGGEPFLIPIDYYKEIGRLQREFIGSKIPYENVVQTNLTVLTDRHVEFLKSQEFFSGLGISFDVYGDQRVDVTGRLRGDTVLKNIQKLIDNDINFGAICVLARNTLPYFREIYRFYNSLGIPCKFLPFYLSAFDDQIATHGVGARELTDALKSIFDEWTVSREATSVDPIDEYINYAVAYISDGDDSRYNKDLDEYTYVVGVDGRVWGHGEAYVNEYAYGNLAHETFGALLTSKSRLRAIETTQRRLAQYCEKCPYYGACPGAFVADASPQQEKLLAEFGCPVREVIEHIVSVLESKEFDDAVLTNIAEQRDKNPALAVNF